MALAAIPLSAHQELYHNIAINLKGAESSEPIEITFTLHAPELLVGFSQAGDAYFDEHWLSTRSEDELKQLIDAARGYLGDRFELQLNNRLVDLPSALKFPTFTTIRDGEGVPPACFEARLTLIPSGASDLQVNHSAQSEKRLLLVVTRPGSFPAVTDLPPGENTVLTLTRSKTKSSESAPPPHAEESKRGWAIPTVGAIVLLALLIGIALRKKNPTMEA